LLKAESLNGESGDRRREGSAKALRSIAEFHKSRRLTRDARDLVEDAIRRHHEISDWRNLPNDVLSYAFMLGFRTPSEARAAARRKEHRNELWSRLLCKPDPESSWDLFVGYWEDKFRPQLLEAQRR